MSEKRQFKYMNPEEAMKIITGELDRPPLDRACTFLKRACGYIDCYQGEASKSREMKELTKVPKEIFTSLLVLDLLGRDYIDQVTYDYVLKYLDEQREGLNFYFFEDKTLLPPDLDCISIGLCLLLKEKKITKNKCKKMVKEIKANSNEKGITYVYLDETNERVYIDPVVCCNTLAFLIDCGHEQVGEPNVHYVKEYLDNGDYLKGTRYYRSPDFFLFFLTRAVIRSPRLRSLFKPSILKALKSRMGQSHYPLDLSMRVICAKEFGFPHQDDLDKLISLQDNWGGFPSDALFTAGKQEVHFGGRVLSTAFAARALI